MRWPDLEKNTRKIKHRPVFVWEYPPQTCLQATIANLQKAHRNAGPVSDMCSFWVSKCCWKFHKFVLHLQVRTYLYCKFVRKLWTFQLIQGQEDGYDGKTVRPSQEVRQPLVRALGHLGEWWTDFRMISTLLTNKSELTADRKWQLQWELYII